MTRNLKTGLTLAFTGKIDFSILGLGLDTSGLVSIPDRYVCSPAVTVPSLPAPRRAVGATPFHIQSRPIVLSSLNGVCRTSVRRPTNAAASQISRLRVNFVARLAIDAAKIQLRTTRRDAVRRSFDVTARC